MTIGGRVRSAVLLAIVGANPAWAQVTSERGSVEARVAGFPQTTPNDSQRVIFDLLVRDEVSVKPTTWLQFQVGVDVRGNTHDQVTTSWRPDFADRGGHRPALSARRLSATLTRGPLRFDLGRQFIRWGKTDVMTPTDRFAPRDFLNVIDADYLGVTAVNTTLQHGSQTFNVVWVPVFTPSRMPLLDQRWSVTASGPTGLSLVDAGSRLPGRAQYGARWGQTATALDYSFSFFDGYNHEPNLDVLGTTSSPSGIEVNILRSYPAIRAFGADAAVPTSWATLKAEGEAFTSRDGTSDDYVLYVVQAERQTGEWLLIGGYAGEAMIHQRTAATFAPDRGVARAFIGRALYTIDANRSVVFESVARQNGRGVYVKGEYSLARGQHWRTTFSSALLRGKPDDFIGLYQRNSHVTLAIRYSF